MSKTWGVIGRLNANFIGHPPSSYLVCFTVESETKPTVSSAIFNPQNSYPNLPVKAGNYGENLDKCATPANGAYYGNGYDAWAIATVGLDNGRSLGVYLAGASVNAPFSSFSWSNGDFEICDCGANSCKITCQNQPNGFCCIDHAFTNGLLNVLKG